MTIDELRKKFNKAHAAFLRYNKTNQTNNVENNNLEEIVNKLKNHFTNSQIILVPDCFLNYLGVDIILLKDSSMITFDLKVCNGDGRGKQLKGNTILIDVKRNVAGVYHSTYEDKINDFYIFKNQNSTKIVSAKRIREIAEKVPEEKLFFMPRDLYKTTKKAVVKLDENDYIEL